MSAIVDVSEALGEFMLKGYVLTDQSCPSPGCAIPMMRTPRGKTPVLTFCVKCSKEQSKAAKEPTTDAPLPSTSNASTDSQSSRVSTPLTEVSAVPSSPTFELPPESDETRRRREQSDRASSELGKKLLQGWAMLGDECPNDECYGIPLVRPPKTGGELNPRKVCVICGGIYKTEADWAGRETLVSFDTHPEAQTAPRKPVDTEKPVPQSPLTRDRFSVKRDEHIQQNAVPSREPTDGLDNTAKALQGSLQALSAQLTALSSQTHLDTISIGSTADTISKVSQALSQVRQLQRKES